MHRPLALILTGALGGLFTAAAAHAEPVFTPLSQERKVTANAGGNEDVDAAIDFAPFAGFAESEAENADTRARTEAQLSSEITASRISFIGRFLIDAQDLDPTDDVLDNLGTLATTINSVEFALSVPHRFTASQSFTFEGSPSADLQGATFLIGPSFSDALGNQSGILEPGTYTLTFTQAFDQPSRIPITASVDFSQQLDLHPIPLPPALWQGLLTIALIGVLAARWKIRIRLLWHGQPCPRFVPPPMARS